MKITLVCLALFCSLAGAAAAAPGDLEPRVCRAESRAEAAPMSSLDREAKPSFLLKINCFQCQQQFWARYDYTYAICVQNLLPPSYCHSDARRAACDYGLHNCSPCEFLTYQCSAF